MFEIGEIEALAPDEDEKAELAAERDRLRHLEGLRAASAGGAEALAPEADAPGAAALLAEAERLAEAVAGVDAELDGLAARLRALRIEAEDLAGELRRYELGLASEPGRLEQVEERLDAYDRLERKHGGSVAAVLEHLERCRRRARPARERGGLDRAAPSATLADAEKAESSARGRAVEGAPQGRAGARRAGARPSWPSWRWRTRRSRSSCSEREELATTGAERAEFLIAPTRACRPRRCATRRRAASSRA